MESWTLPRRVDLIPNCMSIPLSTLWLYLCAHSFVVHRAGNAAGIFISGGICVITTWLWPDNFDFDVRLISFLQSGVGEVNNNISHIQIIRHMNFSTEPTTAAAASSLPAPSSPIDEDSDLTEKDPASVADHEAQPEADVLPVNNINDASEQALYKDFKESVVVTVVVFVLLCIVVPAFAAIPKVWTKAGFVVWIVIIL